MKQWLIPAVVLLLVGGLGVGVGWSINEWQDDSESTPVPAEQAADPTPAGPTQAERDALCLEAQQAAADDRAAHEAREANSRYGISLYGGPPEPVQDAIDRYC